jgi:hypothetical protein
MDLDSLPLVILNKLGNYLNTFDLYSFLIAFEFSKETININGKSSKETIYLNTNLFRAAFREKYIFESLLIFEF